MPRAATTYTLRNCTCSRVGTGSLLITNKNSNVTPRSVSAVNTLATLQHPAASTGTRRHRTRCARNTTPQLRQQRGGYDTDVSDGQRLVDSATKAHKQLRDSNVTPRRPRPASTAGPNGSGAAHDPATTDDRGKHWQGWQGSGKQGPCLPLPSRAKQGLSSLAA